MDLVEKLVEVTRFRLFLEEKSNRVTVFMALRTSFGRQRVKCFCFIGSQRSVNSFGIDTIRIGAELLKGLTHLSIRFELR